MAVELPLPTGPFSVARTSFEWEDAHRLDLYAQNKDELRKLFVWVWYPSESGQKEKANYIPDDWAAAWRSEQGLFRILFQDPQRVQTNSRKNGRLAAGAPFPVIVFFPGFGHIVTDYTAIIEDLVSHGYVVFAPTPTYSASVVVFSDGRIASQKKGILSEDDKSPEEYIASSRPLREQWDADEQFAIDQIQHLNNTPGNMFSGQLDLTEIGLAGHSLGGATALEVCRLDSRCQAAADLDGDTLGATLSSTKPFIVLWGGGAEKSNSNDDPLWKLAYNSIIDAAKVSQADVYILNVRGAHHFNFSDMDIGFYSVMRYLGALGPIAPGKTTEITRAYLVAFFDSYLKGRPKRFLVDQTPFQEVTFSWRERKQF
jgi:dienelactone hydrolase